jgi:hypothetical protein
MSRSLAALSHADLPHLLRAAETDCGAWRGPSTIDATRLLSAF